MIKLSLLFLVICLIAFSSSTTIIFAQDDSPILDLLPCTDKKMSIRGLWESVTNERGETRRVANFRGIRFSNQPVRFSSGSLFDLCSSSAEDGIINATKFSTACPQIGDRGDVYGHEDCLFLNVYVPEKIYNILKSDGSNDSKKTFPINHYFFGGSLTNGNAAGENHTFFSAFCGDSENDEYGCIALTTNYRLNTIGFLLSAAFEKGQVNFGIQDQILSLQWTQKWIGSFGGDNTKVTISGQSSGGTSVFALMSSPLVNGLFRAGFSMSGSPNITISRNAKIIQDLPIIQKLGCSSSHPADEIACLRAVPLDTLVRAQPDSWATPGTWSLAGLKPSGRGFAGLPCVDGVVISHSFRDAIRVGLNQDVTLLIQTEGQEANLIEPDQKVGNYNQLQWRTFLNQTFSAWGSPASAKMANEIYNLYEAESTLNPQLAYDSINSDYGITCASPDLAKQFTVPSYSSNGKQRFFSSSPSSSSPSRQAPIYISINQWPPENPNNFGIWSMCYHLWDYFAATQQWTGYTPTKKDYELSFLMRATWYNLMKDGSLDKMSLLKWEPAVPQSAVVNAVDFKMFVYSRPDRFPFLKNSSIVDNYKRKSCDTFWEYGMKETFWWCN